MKSRSKIDLDKAKLARLAQRHLGKSLVSSREITDGWYNTIHVLELAGGSRAVLKISPPPDFQPMRYERGILATEVAVLRRLAGAGLCVPEVLIECSDGDGLGHPWFIMEFVEAAPWDRLRKECPADRCDNVDASIARQSALVNQIQGERFGRWQEDHCASFSWASSLQSMVDDLLADARDRSVHLPRSEAALRDIFEAARRVLDTVKTPRLVLWDLHDGNVMIRPDTLELAAFLDTDRALWGDPLMEYYFRSIANVPKVWKASYRGVWLEAGVEHPADTTGAAERMVLYDLYLALVLVIESRFRGYQSEHESWARGLLDQALASCDRLV